MRESKVECEHGDTKLFTVVSVRNVSSGAAAVAVVGSMAY